MINDFTELYIALIQAFVIFIALFLIYSRRIFSLFDPLFFFILTQAFSIVLAFMQIEDIGYLLNFFLCQLSFAAGFILLTRKIEKKDLVDDLNISWSVKEHKFWVYFSIIGFIMILFSNIYLISLKGIIVLNDDPTSGKVEAFETGGGIGAVRRINWGLLNLVNLSVLYLYAKSAKKTYLFMLLILTLITVSGGSKSSLLIYVNIIALLGIFKSFSVSNTYKLINKAKAPILILGALLAVFILASNSESLSDAFLALGIRFLYFGDIIFYYYDTDSVKHFQQLNFFDFFKYEFNSLLGLLRIVPYQNPLGYDMVAFSLVNQDLGDSKLGPNLPYYVKGHIFFGAIGAIIYSFFVGVIVGKARAILYHTYNNITSFILVIYLNTLIFTYPQDSALTFSLIIDTLIFSLIPLFISLCLVYEFKTKENLNEQ